ncbi:L-fucose:H+ symporter permease [Gordonia araii]|uniref:L-fucose:H+ symporter permease n=1 Tax=Gordonia araii TaxID=263909 RepID=UPI0002EE7EE3|nr:L-fucose:H+ symporter permease [Gordonia araii]
MTQITTEPLSAGLPVAKPRLVGEKQWVLFVALILCFTAWGIAADLTTPMVAGFKQIFDMSTFQASLVQFAYFGAYFLLALPAAFINERSGYKAGLLSGLGLAAVGSFAFYPAAQIMTFGAFLVALFLIAAGCSILETSANPYVLSLGPAETATRRLNFAQAFNPVGTNIGVLLAALLIMPKLSEPVNRASLNETEARAVRAGQLSAVMGPYLGLGFLLIAIAVSIAVNRAPKIVEEFPEGDLAGQSIPKILFSNKRYVFGVVAQFFNIAGQVCTWTFIIQYVQQSLDGSLKMGAYFLQISLIVFLIGRFVMTWVIGRVRATKVMAVLAVAAVGLALFAVVSPNALGVAAVVGISFCLSLMFPTIYGVALQGLGPATKFGAAGLVMAIVGGAIVPLIQGRILDSTSAAVSFVVPACCFLVVAAYAVYDLRSPQPLDAKKEAVA